MNKLTDKLDKLKKLGVDYVYDKTLISHETIGQILDKDISKIPVVKLKGFIHILKRELNIDISEILEIKEDMVDTKPVQQSQHHSTIVQKIEFKTSDENIKNNNNSWIFYIAVTILIIIFGIVYNTKGNSNDTTTKTVLDTTTQYKQENNSLDNEKSNDLDNKKLQQEPQQAPFKNPQKILAREIAQKSKTVSKILDPITTNLTNINVVNVTKEQPIIKEQQLTITPVNKNSLWIGIINLANNKKINKVIIDPINIKLKDKMLIVTGHENVVFKINSQEVKYNKKGKLYFLFTGSQLMSISKDEFITYNKGKEW